MLLYFKERIIAEGVYICENKATVRQTAKHFGVSKSCVHKDMQVKLKHVNKALYDEVQKIFKENFKSKHIRGGIATRKKFLRLKDNSLNNLQNK